MYLTLLTNYGQAKLATAIATGTPLNLTSLVVGDGSGSPTTPSTSQTALVHQVYSVSLNSVSVDSGNPNYVIAEGVLPAAVGGWTVREAGILDNTGQLFAVCNFPDTIKPVLTDGSTRDLVIRIIMQVSNAAAVTLLIDPSVVLASQSWVLTQGFVKKDGTVPMTGPLTLPSDPTLSLHAATKQYVDSRSGVDSVPIGTVAWFAANTPPASFMECDGSAISRTTYSALFGKIGTSYGVGDGSTTFNLPDLRGRFVRGWDHSQSRDVSIFTANTNSTTSISGISSTATMYVGQPVSGTGIPGGATVATIVSGTAITISAAATATNTGVSLTFSGRAFGSLEADAFKGHTHGLNSVTVQSGTGATAAGLASGTAATTGSTGDAETRPANVALLPCIKVYLLSNVDLALINAAIALYIAKAGDAMTGPLTLAGAPTVNLHAATKLYVDTLVAACQAALGFTPVNKAGDTMAGLLTLSGAPSATLHAATKQYVDTADALKVALTDFTGNQSLAANGYQKLPGGIILQFGSLTPGAARQTVTYPIAFPTAARAVIPMSGNADLVTSMEAATANSVTASNFQMVCYQGGNEAAVGPVMWFAIGY